MDYSSNIDEVGAWIKGVAASINFTLAGRDQSLGRDLAGVAAQGMIDRSVPDAKDPTGSPWAENKEPYKTWKGKKYDAFQPGILTGQMLSLESMLGETVISADEVEMRYGTDTPSAGSLNGAEPPKSKEPPTDRQKAQWFTENGRPFYALDDTIAADCVEEMSEGVDDYLGRQ